MGPGLLAADFLYCSQRRAKRERDGVKTRKTKGDDMMLPLLMRIVLELEGDAPVLFALQAEAEHHDQTEQQLRASISWLVAHEFLAMDGSADGKIRLWVNPSVAFFAGTDPRLAAARHHFPYIVPDQKGLSADEPVHVQPYRAEGWEGVYQKQAAMFQDPPAFTWGCPRHDPGNDGEDGKLLPLLAPSTTAVTSAH
ncbi:hypothetical protein P8605_04820 [Streptomyces sp. T-3]|nr:hypothetical protein [Streptomyces sp. T-3]